MLSGLFPLHAASCLGIIWVSWVCCTKSAADQASDAIVSRGLFIIVHAFTSRRYKLSGQQTTHTMLLMLSRDTPSTWNSSFQHHRGAPVMVFLRVMLQQATGSWCQMRRTIAARRVRFLAPQSCVRPQTWLFSSATHQGRLPDPSRPPPREGSLQIHFEQRGAPYWTLCVGGLLEQTDYICCNSNCCNSPCLFRVAFLEPVCMYLLCCAHSRDGLQVLILSSEYMMLWYIRVYVYPLCSAIISSQSVGARFAHRSNVEMYVYPLCHQG